MSGLVRFIAVPLVIDALFYSSRLRFPFRSPPLASGVRIAAPDAARSIHSAASGVQFRT
jgi:hypothetical protein